MQRRCTCCGALVRWSDLAPISDGLDQRSVFFGLAMANHYCDGPATKQPATIAEPVGVLFAARVVARALPTTTRIEVCDASL